MPKEALVIAIGKPKSKGLEPGGGDEPDEDDDVDLDEAEMDAAKLAYNAKSPEQYAKALKLFVKLCYENSEEKDY